MKNHQNAIRRSQQLQFEGDMSKKTSVIVKTPPPVEQPPVIVEEQPIIVEEILEENLIQENTGSISIVKKENK
jgi:hypothetical protein